MFPNFHVEILGIEGIRKGDGTSSKAFKTTKTREQVTSTIRAFTSSSAATAVHTQLAICYFSPIYNPALFISRGSI